MDSINDKVRLPNFTKILILLIYILYLKKINIFGNYLFTYQGQYILKILRVKNFNCPLRLARCHIESLLKML